MKRQLKLFLDESLRVTNLEDELENGFVVSRIDIDKPKKLEDVIIPELCDLIKHSISCLLDINQQNLTLRCDIRSLKCLIKAEADLLGGYVFTITTDYEMKEIMEVRDSLREVMLRQMQFSFFAGYEENHRVIQESIEKLSEHTNSSHIFLFAEFEKSYFWSVGLHSYKSSIVSQLKSAPYESGLKIAELNLNGNQPSDEANEFHLIMLRKSSIDRSCVCLGVRKTDFAGQFFKHLVDDLKMIVYLFFCGVERLKQLSQLPQRTSAITYFDKTYNTNIESQNLIGSSETIGINALVIHQDDGKVINCNDVFYEWTGGKGVNINLFDVIEPYLSADELRSKYLAAADFIYDADFNPVTDNGSFPVRIQSSAMNFGSGTIFYSVVKDLTTIGYTSVKSTKEIDEYREIIRQLCHTVYGFRVDIASGKYIMDWLSGDLIDMPFDSSEDLFEMEKFLLAVHPDDYPIVFRKDEMISNLKNHTCLYRLKDNKGNFRWVKDYHWYLGRGKNNLPEFCGAVQDYTEEIVTISELELFKTAISNSSNIVLILNQKGFIDYVNPAVYKEIGIDYESLDGKHVSILSEVFVDRNTFEPKIFSLVEESVVNQRAAIINKDGETQQFVFTTTTIYNSFNEVINYIIIGQNITRIDDLEKQLIVRDKLSTLGLLTSSVAHDVNNIIQVIESYTELVELRSDSGSQVRHYAQSIKDALQRGTVLMSQVLNYGRPEFYQDKEVMFFEKVVNESLVFIKSFVPKNINIYSEVNPNIRIIGNRVNLQQILVNLIKNSIEALGTRMGHIGIIGDIDRVHIEGIEGIQKCLKIAISDDGKGMSKEMVSKIFSPYFSSKKKDSSVKTNYGLGLFIVDTVVKNYNGKIIVESNPGLGTTFTIYLPILKP